MPARKPAALNTRHDLKSDQAERLAGESALTPKTGLQKRLPAALSGHFEAAKTWRRIVGLYLETEGTIVTAFDMDLLVKYCLLEEEVLQLAADRQTIRGEWETQFAAAHTVELDPEHLKDWNHMWEVVNALFARYQGMDARLDGKRKLLHTLSQSLYLTPRSRAGVAPSSKEPEKPKSEMEALLEQE